MVAISDQKIVLHTCETNFLFFEAIQYIKHFENLEGKRIYLVHILYEKETTYYKWEQLQIVQFYLFSWNVSLYVGTYNTRLMHRSH